VHALPANDLVDAISIFTVPVVLGGGKKLFADGSAPHSDKLTRSRVSSMGLVIAGSSIVDGIIIVVDFAGVIVNSVSTVRFAGGTQRPVDEACYRILASRLRARRLKRDSSSARVARPLLPRVVRPRKNSLRTAALEDPGAAR
jgi:hypothetical protein